MGRPDLIRPPAGVGGPWLVGGAWGDPPAATPSPAPPAGGADEHEHDDGDREAAQ